MAKRNAAAKNAAVDETALVKNTTAKTYTQEELDAILAEKLKEQNETITYTQEELDAILAEKLKEQNETIEALQEKPEFIQDNPEGEEMEIIKIPMYLGPNDDPRGEYVAVNGVAMFVPRGKVCKIKKKYADRLKMSLNLREVEHKYIRANEGTKEVTL